MKHRRVLALFLYCFALGCRSHPVLEPDRPQLTPNVRLIDDQFHSDALGRDMEVRIIVPSAGVQPNEPVVYLLHGAGVNYYDWTNNSAIASFAAKGVVLVLPNMPNAYYINQANEMDYEDFLLKELVPEVHKRIPNASNLREHTAIIGISRGGYGSVTVGLRHTDTFGFVGGISPALDFAERHFRWHDPLASLESRRVFGAQGSSVRKNNDPYFLIRHLPPERAPALFIAWGDREVLAPVAKRFVSLATGRNIPIDFHEFPGDHDWSTWNAALPSLEATLLRFFNSDAARGKAV